MRISHFDQVRKRGTARMATSIISPEATHTIAGRNTVESQKTYWKKRAETRWDSGRGFCQPTFGRESNSRFIAAAASVERWVKLDKFTAVSPWVVYTARGCRTRHARKQPDRLKLVASRSSTAV
jgi:hypothetical protein